MLVPLIKDGIIKEKINNPKFINIYGLVVMIATAMF